MGITLYLVHGSHPCAAVARAMEMKGIEPRIVELPPPLHAPIQRLLFGTRTVPAISIDGGEKISGSRAIMRRLDELVPEPPLLPADPALRERVLEAERWGDEVLQPIGRRLIWPAMKNSPGAAASYGEHSRLPAPAPLVQAITPVVSRIAMRLNATSDETATRELAELPEKLDRVDGWIAEGVIGDAAHPNAADLQIASTIRLMLTMADVEPLLAGRPCRQLAEAIWPLVDGHMPAGSLVAPAA